MKTENTVKRAKLNLKKSNLDAKRRAKELNLLAAQKARNAHREAMKKQQPEKKSEVPSSQASDR